MQNSNSRNTTLKLGIAALAAVLACVFANEGNAQSTSKGYGQAISNNYLQSNSASRFSTERIRNSILGQSVTNVGIAGVNSRNFLSSTGSSPLTRPTKPFTGATSRPTVSPYLALSGPRSTASDYYNVVRPQQQLQRQNQRQQAFAIRRQQKLNQMAARAPYSVTGDETRMGTGHAAVFQSLGSFQNTGGYFPPPSQPKRRR